MKLEKVYFQNYRCFKNFELELDPRLTVIVGNNGAGKTAVLDGIATILSKSFNHLSTANQRFSDQGKGISDTDIRMLPVDEGGYLAEFSYLKAESSIGSWDLWRASDKNTKPIDLIGEKELKDYLLEIIESYKKGNSRKLTPVFVYYGSDRANRESIQRLRDSKINYDYPTSALINSLTVNKQKDSLREALEWFDKAEAAELRKARESNQANKDFSHLDNVRSAISSILGKNYNNPRFNSKHKFVLTKDVNSEIIEELSILQLSQGYQSMLTLAMDFSRRLSIANDHLQAAALNAPSIMLIDEVDLHLHPSWQQRVLGDLMRTFPNTQFIVTTHSPQVLTTVPSECIRMIDGQSVYPAPAGSEGAESSRLLNRIFNVDSRPPQNEVTKQLIKYRELVYLDKWNSTEALELRHQLDKVFQGNDPELTRLDLYIDNREWELSLEENQ